MLSELTCRPIDCLDELFDWDKSNIKREYVVEQLNKAVLKKHDDKSSSNKKIMLCHDMKNNYLEDKYFQGFNTANGYRFYDWNLIDSFIYFSHHFITIPTESFINACHLNHALRKTNPLTSASKPLTLKREYQQFKTFIGFTGTFITEFNDGLEICNRFLHDRNIMLKVVDILVDITIVYGFDGWLLNIENPIKIDHLDNLKELVKELTSRLHAVDPIVYKVIWYDSVINTGQLKWQNELNNLNREFFDLCDGFFVNYTWNFENLRNCVENAKKRCKDVWVGIDVFGRNCFGGGGYNCNLAFEEIWKHNLNIALFAPGWIHETQDESQFIDNSHRFWSAIEKYICKRKLSHLPVAINFSHGCGDSFYVNGKLISNTPWFNMNLQAILPSITSVNQVNWCFEDAFYGGNCVIMNENQSFKLLDLDMELASGSFVQFDYVFKIECKLEEPKCAKYEKDFYVSLEYTTDDDDRSHMSLTLTGQTSTEKNKMYNLVQFIEEPKNESWQMRSYLICIKKKLNAQSLYLHNKHGYKTKIGFIRFFERSESTILHQQLQNPIKQITLKDQHTLRLLNKHYFFVEIDWNLHENFKTNDFTYWNVFLTEKSSNVFKYVGTTKAQNYKLCLELDNYEFPFGSNHEKHNEASSCRRNVFRVHLQTVDRLLNKTNINDKDANIDVVIPGRAKIERVVYDFDFI